MELDPKRIECAEHNCVNVYKVPHEKVQFINASISDADVCSALGLEKGKRDNRVVFFFDPPWGGLDYKDKAKMTFDDFKPYPMKNALTNALKITNNVILKLPKN